MFCIQWSVEVLATSSILLRLQTFSKTYTPEAGHPSWTCLRNPIATLLSFCSACTTWLWPELSTPVKAICSVRGTWPTGIIMLAHHRRIVGASTQQVINLIDHAVQPWPYTSEAGDVHGNNDLISLLSSQWFCYPYWSCGCIQAESIPLPTLGPPLTNSFIQSCSRRSFPSLTPQISFSLLNITVVTKDDCRVYDYEVRNKKFRQIDTITST